MQLSRFGIAAHVKNSRVKDFVSRGCKASIDDRMFYVYLLQSISDHGFYIDFSTNLKKRLAEHKRGASLSTKHRGRRQRPSALPNERFQTARPTRS
jgi:hypothetical protein